MIRINSIPPKELFYRYIHVREKPEGIKSYTAADRVELTSEAKAFSAAFKAAKEAVGNRTPDEIKRIEEVKQQIKDATYSVSGFKVAEKILGK